MKKDSKVRLFEVMGRLDKTFKPKLNEGFEELEASTDAGVAPEMGSEVPAEKTPEEKLQELTAKIDELYALLHGEEEKPEEESDEESTENLQEWNFDKKKGDKKEDKEDEESETPAEEKKEHSEKKDLDEAKPKVPVAAIAKVGK